MTCFLSGAAFATPKPWIFSWWPSHWENQDFEPYIEPAKEPHNSQWDAAMWKPEDWAAKRGGNGWEVIDGFYQADILRDQYMDDTIPVLEVGSRFYMLGGQDKRRVVRMVDDIYGITTGKENGLFMLYDGETEKPVGVYTRYGLQLQ